MTREQRQEVINALIEFIIRASKEGATPTEVATLPEVAKIILSFQTSI